MEGDRALDPRADGIRSFIRFRQRIRVDLPQPEGPISAVISFFAMSKVTLRTAGLSPYETVTSSSWKIGSRGLPSARGGAPSMAAGC